MLGKLLFLKHSKILEDFRDSQNQNYFEMAILKELGYFSVNIDKNIKAKIKYTHTNTKRKWEATIDKFKRRNPIWLDEFTTFGELMEEEVYPSTSKGKGRPPKPNTIISDISAEVKLLDLMNHTESLLDGEAELHPENLTLLNKWECDGSSGQSAYKHIVVLYSLNMQRSHRHLSNQL